MQNKKESGFSIIELLLVVVIIGVIAAIAVPALRRGISAADNGSAFATMRTIISLEVGFYAQNNRFARLTEINAIQQNSLGTMSGTNLIRGNFTFTMSPNPSPTDAELRESYKITATKPATTNDDGYQITADQTGQIY